MVKSRSPKEYLLRYAFDIVTKIGPSQYKLYNNEFLGKVEGRKVFKVRQV